MFLMASRGEGVARWLMVETGGKGQAEGGRRKAEGGRVTVESGRGGGWGTGGAVLGGDDLVAEVQLLGGNHSWTTEEFVRREEGSRSPLLRGCSFVWLLCFGW